VRKRWRRATSCRLHLEPVLQALVRDGILKGIRGPRGGYEVAREQAKITAEDILNSVGRIEQADEPLPESELIGAVVRPTLAIAEQYFSAALREINVADLVRQALRVRGHGLRSFDKADVRFGSKSDIAG
jgi:DNA-binding IscR family transcriptional regulator